MPSDPAPPPATTLSLTGPRLAAAARSEWLLTNGLGGFAMGTPFLTPQRRYHALLIAATAPPVGRIAALKSIDERLVVEGMASTGCVALNRFHLSAFHFVGTAPPADPWMRLVEFTRAGDECLWRYEHIDAGAALSLTRRLRLRPARNVCDVSYSITAGKRRCWLELRPLVSMRDFHEHQREEEAFGRFRVAHDEEGALDKPVTIELDNRALTLRLSPSNLTGRYVAEHDFWRNFEHKRDIERGQDGTEDLFCPGVFLIETTNPNQPTDFTLSAGLDDDPSPSPREGLGWVDAVPVPIASTSPAAANSRSQPVSDVLSALHLAASQFIVRRDLLATPNSTNEPGVSIIAGYPWFSDWGRDTFISLPGLLLATGRFKEARTTLESFAALRRRGLIPNCFENGSGTPEYNTVDASLWYIQAAAAYLHATNDRAGFAISIRQACLDIVEAYRKGTDFGIRVDPSDGLIVAGHTTTQLTWMDAKRDGVVFTPRHGKAVEINALWCSGLMLLAEAIEQDQPRTARELRQQADLAGRSFKEQFWDNKRRCLADVLTPHAGRYEPSPEIRPNQIFAVSLPHSPLYPEQQRAVLDCVRTKLLTPMGLRTLDPADAKYEGRYEGNLFKRDGAYHNGTVWPWLIGPYAEAVLRVGNFSAPSKEEARKVIAPLLDTLRGKDVLPPASILTLPEVFDGDDAPGKPRRADGCMAQAWSIAELLRIYTLIEKP